MQSMGYKVSVAGMAAAAALGLGCLGVSNATAVVVGDNLIYAFSDYSDLDGTNGWQSSVQPDTSAETLPLTVAEAGGPDHVTNGAAKYFHTDGSSQAFAASFGGSNLTSNPSYTDWSLEFWLRRNGPSYHVTTEQAVFGMAANDVGNFIF